MKAFGPLLINCNKCKPSHGPKVWPWWRIVKITFVRTVSCEHPDYKAWNIWSYTRWGAWCWGWYPERRDK